MQIQLETRIAKASFLAKLWTTSSIADIGVLKVG